MSSAAEKELARTTRLMGLEWVENVRLIFESENTTTMTPTDMWTQIKQNYIAREIGVIQLDLEEESLCSKCGDSRFSLSPMVPHRASCSGPSLIPTLSVFQQSNGRLLSCGHEICAGVSFCLPAPRPCSDLS